MNASASQSWSVNTTVDTFEQDVFVRSRELPVVVDFWAPWCGPCRALGPILEQLAASYGGKFLLVKANTDEVPAAAARFNVSGIPAVFAVFEEQVLDFFSGALPEAHVRQWLDRLLEVAELRSLRPLERQSPDIAAAKYREILDRTPDQPEAKLGLARVMASVGRSDEAQRLLKQLADRGLLDVDGQKLQAQLELHRGPPADLAARRAAVRSNPDDLTAQFQLAESLAAEELYDEALDILLTLFQRDKKGFGPRAKDLMVKIFQALPEDSESAATYRRKLSIAMY